MVSDDQIESGSKLHPESSTGNLIFNCRNTTMLVTLNTYKRIFMYNCLVYGLPSIRGYSDVNWKNYSLICHSHVLCSRSIVGVLTLILYNKIIKNWNDISFTGTAISAPSSLSRWRPGDSVAVDKRKFMNNSKCNFFFCIFFIFLLCRLVYFNIVMSI